MLIRSLIVEDLGLFHGRHEFDLVPRVRDDHTRPMVLFGGCNGTGKTTLLNSLKLCLYGRAAFGDRVRTTTYKALLCEHIHQDLETLPSGACASVCVEFDHTVMGVKESFNVMRRWHTRDGTPAGITKELDIRKNGQPLEDLETEHWNDFLRGLLPIGLTQLFFFDGEKIERLAQDDNNEELSESIQSLLGLNLVERLQADLDVYLHRHIADHLGNEGDVELAHLEKEIAKQGDQHQVLLNQLADLRAHEIDPCQSELDTNDRKLRDAGAGFLEDRDRLLEERATLRAKIEVDEERIRHLANTVLPFAICRTLSQDLADTLTAVSPSGTIDELAPEITRLTDQLFTNFVRGTLGGSTGIPAETRRNVREVLRRGLAELASENPAPTEDDRTAILAALSPSDRQNLLTWLKSALDECPKEAPPISARIEKHARRLHAIEIELNRAPDKEALRPLYEARRRLDKRLGALEQQAAFLRDDITRVVRERQRSERLHTGVAQKLTDAGVATERLETVKKVKGALTEYQEAGTAAKIESLEREVAHCFGFLCRKPDFVSRVEIDPKTFSTRLYGPSGQALRKDKLSAGEKQLFAISILWALGRSCGRPLPVIVDTPLARLDHDHRGRLLGRYFPNASHQVILFSTDTEVDKQFFQAIQEDVSHSFHLRYDSTQKRTTAREGYFWDLAGRDTQSPSDEVLN